MKGNRILVSGLTNVETNVWVGSFPIEYSPIEYLFDASDLHVSGTAYNISMGLRALDDEVSLITVLGNDLMAELVKKELSDKGISLDGVFQIIPKTCSSTVLYDETGRRKIYCDLRHIQDIVLPLGEMLPLISGCDGLIVTNINFNDELIHKAKEFGKPVFTDVQVLSDVFDSYNKRFMENADVLFLSDEGLPCSPEEFLASIYNEYHNKAIVLGRGSEGALLYEGDKGSFRYLDAVYTRPVVNTVGAGDALFSCFVHFYLLGLSAYEALKKATYFASYKIGDSGGGVGFIDEKGLEDLIKGENKKN